MKRDNLKAELLKKKIKQKTVIDRINADLSALDINIATAENTLKLKRSALSDINNLLSDTNHSLSNTNTLLSTTDAKLSEKLIELELLSNKLLDLDSSIVDLRSEQTHRIAEFDSTLNDLSSIALDHLSKFSDSAKSAIITKNSFTVASQTDLDAIMNSSQNSVLLIESHDGKINVVDNRTNEKKITPFKQFTQIKPMHGRHKTEVYSVDSVLKVINQYKPWSDQLDKKLITEQKFDGVRLQVHKKGDKIKAWTEDGGNVTKKLPTLMESLQKVGHDFVIEGEIELFIDGIHQHRSITAGSIHVKGVHPDEQFIKLSAYDLLWFDGNNIHDEEFTDRYEKMKFLKDVNNVQVSDQIITTSKKQLIAAIKKLSSIPGSEGAMIKLPSYKYELDGTTRNMIKFKKELSLDVKIINKHSVKGSPDTFNYDCVVGEDTYIGKTFNTNTTSKTGIIKVAFGDLFQYTDPKTKEIHFRWVFPRVIEAREDKKTPDSVQTAKDIVKQLDTPIRKKRLPKLDSASNGISTVEGDANPYMMLPDPNEDFKFIIQRHYRGESSHLDMRIDTERKLGIDDPQYSILGWTMLDSVAGRVDEPITTVSKAKEFDNKNIWKIDWDKGIFKTHKQIKSITPKDTPGYAKLSDDDERAQIESVKKSVHPTAWMTYKGVIDKPEPGEPVPPGATKEFPGVLTIIESGKIEWGCFPPYEKVLTNEGLKQIDSIAVGDSLLGDNAEWVKVVNTFNRKADKLITFNVRGSNTTSMSENHPCFAVKRTPDLKLLKDWEFKPQWHNASELNKGDFLALPKIKAERPVTIHLRNSRTKLHTDYDIDEETAWMLGYFMGDGYASSSINQFDFCINNSHDYISTRLSECMESKFNLQTKTRTGKGCFYNSYNSQELTDYLRKTFYIDNKKTVPAEFIFMKKPILRAFLKGYYAADGSKITNNGQLTLTSVNPDNQKITLLMFAKLGTIPGGTSKRSKAYRMTWLKKYLNLVDDEPETNIRHSRSFIEDNEYFYLRISDKTVENYNGTVYNLETEDNTIYTPFKTHNSQKPYYHEYFVDGKHMKGRLSFRQLEREVEGKKQLWWTCIQPEDQTPYVISARAVKKEWIPPKGHSALPESIRKKIPKDLQYWDMSPKAALEARKKIVDEIKHGRIVIDCGCTQDKRTDKPELEIEFKLQKQTWKGPTVIRAKPSRTEYHLLLKMPSKYIDFISEQYPENSYTAIKDTAHVLRWRTTGELSPKHKLNKTKATPSRISIADSGKAKLVLDGDNQKMVLTLKGKELKGELIATRQGPKTDMWDMVLK